MRYIDFLQDKDKPTEHSTNHSKNYSRRTRVSKSIFNPVCLTMRRVDQATNPSNRFPKTLRFALVTRKPHTLSSNQLNRRINSFIKCFKQFTAFLQPTNPTSASKRTICIKICKEITFLSQDPTNLNATYLLEPDPTTSSTAFICQVHQGRHMEKQKQDDFRSWVSF